ncbi:MAG: class II aldolase/adducin family protein [Proteobacteria bacterium]|nr:MAG: class II aldolase/adducin family protein [Pseudomonadota bacterium]
MPGVNMCETTESGTGAGAASNPAVDRGVPAAPVERSLLDELVIANRVLFKHRVVDAFGHVSIRHDKDPERFLLARNMAPGLVTAEDIVEFHLDGTPVDAVGRSVYLERFIHGAIYRARPKVQAVVHSHAPAVVPFGVSASARLMPVWHMSGFLGLDTPVFEIRDVAGDATDLLIRSNRLGDALAASLGDACVVLMRGHGATVTGDSLRQAVFRAVYTQLNAELQLQAVQLGDVRYLTEGEVRTTTDSVGSQIDRAWNLWKCEVAN